MTLATRRCDRCGSDVSVDDVHCGYCHFRLPERADADAPPLTERAGPSERADPSEHHGPAERRRRRPSLLVAGAVAVVSVAAVVAALVVRADDDSASPVAAPADTPRVIAELVDAPVPRWTAALDGVLSGFDADDDRAYAITATDLGTTLVAFDLGSGEVAWRTELSSEASTGAGQVAVIGVEGESTGPVGGVGVLSGSALTPGRRFSLFDPSSGAVVWQSETAPGTFGIEGDHLIGSGASREFRQPIDVGSGRLGEAVEYDRSFEDDDGSMYLDVDGVLRSVDPTTLVADGRISFEHSGEVTGVGSTGDGAVVIATGDALVGIAPGEDAQRWSAVPNLGALIELWPLGGGRFVVEGDLGFRVVTLGSEGPVDLGDVRSFATVVMTQRTGGHAYVVTSQVNASAFGRTVVTILAADDEQLRPVGTITDFITPVMASSGSVLYVVESSQGGGYQVQRRLAAYGFADASSLWSIPLGATGSIRPTPTGVMVIDGRPGGDGSDITFYAAADR